MMVPGRSGTRGGRSGRSLGEAGPRRVRSRAREDRAPRRGAPATADRRRRLKPAAPFSDRRSRPPGSDARRRGSSEATITEASATGSVSHPGPRARCPPRGYARRPARAPAAANPPRTRPRGLFSSESDATDAETAFPRLPRISRRGGGSARASGGAGTGGGTSTGRERRTKTRGVSAPRSRRRRLERARRRRRRRFEHLHASWAESVGNASLARAVFFVRPPPRGASMDRHHSRAGSHHRGSERRRMIVVVPASGSDAAIVAGVRARGRSSARRLAKGGFTGRWRRTTSSGRLALNGARSADDGASARPSARGRSRGGEEPERAAGRAAAGANAPISTRGVARAEDDARSRWRGRGGARGGGGGSEEGAAVVGRTWGGRWRSRRNALPTRDDARRGRRTRAEAAISLRCHPSRSRNRAPRRAQTELFDSRPGIAGFVSSAVPLRPQRRCCVGARRSMPLARSAARARVLRRFASARASSLAMRSTREEKVIRTARAARARARPAESSRSPRVGPEHPNNNAFVDFLKTAGERVKSTFAHDELVAARPPARRARPRPRPPRRRRGGGTGSCR